MICGVRNTTSSVFFFVLVEPRNGIPRIGMSPRIGRRASVRSCFVSMSPPMMSVTPLFTSTFVSASVEVTMGMRLLRKVVTSEVLTSGRIFIWTWPSGLMFGVT